MNDYLINVRLPRELVEHARQIANEQGMCLSSFVRQAIHRNVQTYIQHERALIAKRVVR